MRSRLDAEIALNRVIAERDARELEVFELRSQVRGVRLLFHVFSSGTSMRTISDSTMVHCSYWWCLQIQVLEAAVSSKARPQSTVVNPLYSSQPHTLVAQPNPVIAAPALTPPPSSSPTASESPAPPSPAAAALVVPASSIPQHVDSSIKRSDSTKSNSSQKGPSPLSRSESVSASHQHAPPSPLSMSSSFVETVSTSVLFGKSQSVSSISSIASLASLMNKSSTALSVFFQRRPKLPCLTSTSPDAVNLPELKSHKLAINTFLQPTKCCVCCAVMRGGARQGLVCNRCKFTCHVSCMSKIQPHFATCPINSQLSDLPQSEDAVLSVSHSA
jgi:hypothetical protein